MKKLPHWCITDKFPAFYDTESATAIEQTAKVYAAMQTLIEEYNAFVDDVNNSVDEFTASADKNYQAFTYEMGQKFQNFIDVIELKVADMENYMKTNLYNSVGTILTELIYEVLDEEGIILKLNGEKRKLYVGKDVFPSQKLTLNYYLSQGCTISKATNDLNISTTKIAALTADSDVTKTHTITVSSDVYYYQVTGLYGEIHFKDVIALLYDQTAVTNEWVKTAVDDYLEENGTGGSAYEIWLAQGNTGTEEEFLASLKGADGTSVTITSISESTDDGGSNVVTFSDGTTLTIKNGSKGSTGATGETGSDYVLTDTDKQEIAALIGASIPDGNEVEY